MVANGLVFMFCVRPQLPKSWFNFGAILKTVSFKKVVRQKFYSSFNLLTWEFTTMLDILLNKHSLVETLLKSQMILFVWLKGGGNEIMIVDPSSLVPASKKRYLLRFRLPVVKLWFYPLFYVYFNWYQIYFKWSEDFFP